MERKFTDKELLELRETCPVCGAHMACLGEKKLQLGEAELFMGHWENIVAGALKVALYQCPRCGKIAFYAADEKREEGESYLCDSCHRSYPRTAAKCPVCGRQNPDYENSCDKGEVK